MSEVLHEVSLNGGPYDGLTLQFDDPLAVGTLVVLPARMTSAAIGEDGWLLTEGGHGYEDRQDGREVRYRVEPGAVEDGGIVRHRSRFVEATS